MTGLGSSRQMLCCLPDEETAIPPLLSSQFSLCIVGRSGGHDLHAGCVT